jgi:hypothetical protein
MLVTGEQLPAPAVHFGAFKKKQLHGFYPSLNQPYAGDLVKGDEMG